MTKPAAAAAISMAIQRMVMTSLLMALPPNLLSEGRLSNPYQRSCVSGRTMLIYPGVLFPYRLEQMSCRGVAHLSSVRSFSSSFVF
jgi:hypothetical protein